VLQDGVLDLRGHPHAAARAVLLEVAFVQAPQFNVGASRPCSLCVPYRAFCSLSEAVLYRAATTIEVQARDCFDAVSPEEQSLLSVSHRSEVVDRDQRRRTPSANGPRNRKPAT
jgi:hypothetical protein